MENLFLGKFDRRWFTLIMPVFAVLVMALLVINDFLALGKKVEMHHVFVLIMVSLAIAFTVSLFGFLNALILSVCSALGVLTGLALMLFFYLKGGGWEDLIGPIVFVEFMLCGVGAGVIGEIVIRIYKWIRK